MRTLQALMIAGALALPASASAQTDYKADDIVEHFVGKPKDGEGDVRSLTEEKDDNLGATKGVKIGASGFGDDDKDEGGAKPAVLSSDAFNLLVTFAHDSDRLTGRAQDNLREFAKALQRPELSELSFAVEGHTDDIGTEEYNLDLSNRRAMAVVRFLEAAGIESERLKPRGYGETRPAKPQASHPDNRRVETRLLSTN